MEGKNLAATAMNRLLAFALSFLALLVGLAAGMTVATWRTGAFGSAHAQTPPSVGGENAASSPSSRPAAATDMEEAILTNLLTTIRGEENSFRTRIELCRLLERLGPVEIPGLLARAMKLPLKYRRELLAGLLERWFEMDIAGAEKWLRANQGRSTEFAEIWARFDPKAALQEALAGRLSSSRVPFVALNQLAGSEPKARLAILASFPPSLNRDHAIEAEIHDWEHKDPATALQATQMMVTGLFKERAEQGILTTWASIDPVEAIKKAKELFPNPKADLYGNEFITFFTSTLAKKDPTLALNYALGLDEDLRKYPLIAAATSWAETDAVGALTWSYENGVNITSGLRSAGASSGGSVLGQALQNQPKETIQWLLDLPQADGQERIFWEACRVLTETTEPGDLMAQPDLPLSQFFQRLSPGKQDDVAQTIGMRIGRDGQLSGFCGLDGSLRRQFRAGLRDRRRGHRAFQKRFDTCGGHPGQSAQRPGSRPGARASNRRPKQ